MFTQLELADRIAFYVPVLLSLTVHEWAHAWTAWKLGDDTARMLGRLSLNPLDHIDPIGTLLPLLGVPFGWARPVPINPVRFRQNIPMSWGILLTAAAGPVSNLLIAGGCAIALLAFRDRVTGPLSPTMLVIPEMLRNMLLINAVLALFNVLPVPPLDGSRIVEALVPNSLRSVWNDFCAMGPFLLAIIILLPLAGINLLAVPLQWITQVLQPFGV